MRKSRRRLVTVAAVLASLAAACSDDDATNGSSSTTNPGSPLRPPTADATTTSTTAEPLLPLTEDQAAREFITAWSRSDRTTMAEIARPDELVEQALALGTPTGSIERFAAVGYVGADAHPQVQCVLPLTNGRRAYLVMDGPGTGVNWVADYVPH